MIDPIAMPAVDGQGGASVSPVPSAPAATTSTTGRGAGDASASARLARAAPASPTTRMLIESDGAHGFVYRLVDTLTGRTLVEAPREELDQLTGHPAYAAGALVSTSA